MMFDKYQRNPQCTTIKLKLLRSRRALHQAIRNAKDDWIIMQVDRVDDEVYAEQLAPKWHGMPSKL